MLPPLPHMSTDTIPARRPMPRLRTPGRLFARWCKNTSGQDLIEYALLAAFISVTALAAASELGVSVNGWYEAIAGVIGEEEESSGGGKGSNCSATGMVASGGKCRGG